MRPVPTKLRFPNKAVDTTPGAGPAPLPDTHHRRRMIVVALVPGLDGNGRQPGTNLSWLQATQIRASSSPFGPNCLPRPVSAPTSTGSPLPPQVSVHYRTLKVPCPPIRSESVPPPPKKEAQTVIVKISSLTDTKEHPPQSCPGTCSHGQHAQMTNSTLPKLMPHGFLSLD